MLSESIYNGIVPPLIVVLVVTPPTGKTRYVTLPNSHGVSVPPILLYALYFTVYVWFAWRFWTTCENWPCKLFATHGPAAMPHASGESILSDEFAIVAPLGRSEEHTSE